MVEKVSLSKKSYEKQAALKTVDSKGQETLKELLLAVMNSLKLKFMWIKISTALSLKKLLIFSCSIKVLLFAIFSCVSILPFCTLLTVLGERLRESTEYVLSRDAEQVSYNIVQEFQSELDSVTDVFKYAAFSIIENNETAFEDLSGKFSWIQVVSVSDIARDRYLTTNLSLTDEAVGAVNRHLDRPIFENWFDTRYASFALEDPGSLVVSDLVENAVGDRIIFLLMAHPYQPSLIIGAISEKFLSMFFENLTVYDDITIGLVDRSGNAITASRARDGVLNVSKNTELTWLDSDTAPDLSRRGYGFKALKSKLFDSEKEQIQDVYGYKLPISESGVSGWSLVYQKQLSRDEKIYLNIDRPCLYFVATFLCLCFVLSCCTTKVIMRPIRKVWQLDNTQSDNANSDLSSKNTENEAVANFGFREFLNFIDRFKWLSQQHTLSQEKIDWQVSSKLAKIEKEMKERERVTKQIGYNALYDSLTGLPNRRWLDSYLERVLGSSGNKNHILCMSIQVSGMGALKSKYGYIVNDSILKTIARNLENIACDDATLVRTDAYEFTLVLNHPEAESMLCELRSLLERENTRRTVINDGQGLSKSPDADLEFCFEVYSHKELGEGYLFGKTAYG